MEYEDEEQGGFDYDYGSNDGSNYDDKDPVEIERENNFLDAEGKFLKKFFVIFIKKK